MAYGSKVPTQKEVHAIEDRIVKECDQLTRSLLEYMRILGMTGIRTPTPPRPKYEVARVGRTATLTELAFRAMGGN